MPQDIFQIALEHHRGGRLREAEAGYRAALERDPQHADAAHWLGILLVQAGQPEAAVPLLERAVAAKPDDAAFVHNLAQACLNCGRADDAIATFDRAINLAPDRPDALLAAATARLARRAPGDADDALTLLKRAQLEGLGSPELHQYLAVALLTTGRVDEAIAECTIAIERNPEYAEAHYHLGVAHRQKGNVEEALSSMRRAVELQPEYPRACQNLAVLEAEVGRFPEAEALLRRVITLKPDARDAHQTLGLLLQRMGRYSDATVAFVGAMRAGRGELPRGGAPVRSSAAVAELERKITPRADAASLHFRLATQADIVPPSQVPAASVSKLFDRYADLFDEHLRSTLEYRAPELIVDAVKATNPGSSLDVLDLGCGTGLCGPLLRPIARTLAGVDLSPAMVEKARERDVYDRLEVKDILDTLRGSPQAWDLLVAADVLMYLGDLTLVFDAAVAALRPGGRFAFTVESGEGDRFQLGKQTHRFAHSRPYLEHLSRIFGFETETLEEITVRKEAGQPVRGLLAVLRLPQPET
ncbi:MAG TPA: tetratricopeptide repeat protein [Tepidisphaeraceae bacterium]|jgi:predicted TPR repeat methyltransferase